MADVRSQYCNTTMIGNWYEDRLDTSKVDVDPRLLRTNNVTETPIKMARKVENPYTSLQRDSYQMPRRLRPETEVAICTTSTIAYTYGKEPAYGLPLHGPDRTLRELATTNHSEHGGPYASDPSRRPRSSGALTQSGSEMMAAGVISTGRKLPKAHPGPQYTAVGENLSLDPRADPKANTSVQRSWRYTTEHQVYRQDFSDKSDYTQNLPGLGFKGVGIEHPRSTGINHALGRPNDALSDKTGIWSG